MHSRLAALTIVTALVAATASVSIPASAVGTFIDDDGNVHEAAIERIAALGITRGCNPPDNTRFCPDDKVTRGQMAAFLVRTFHLTATGSNFTDTSSSVFAQDIDRLATAGITRGCNPPDNTRYCPVDLVTRGQMAAFLVRALGLTDLSTSAFTDTIGHVFEQDISRLAAAGITRGCNPPTNDRFCPDQPIRRDEMAAFLNRTYDIQVTGTTTSTTATTATSSTLTSSTSPTTSPTTNTPKPPPGWKTMEPLDAGLTDAAGAHLEGMLYLAGGKRSPTNRVDDFLLYDPATDGWTTLADIPGPGREDVSLVAADGRLYVFGGASQNAFEGNIQTAARFTPGSGWSDPAVADLASGRSGAAAVLYGGDIWLIGGFGLAGVSLSSVLIYDLATDTYSSGPPLPSPRDHAGAAVVGGDLYVFGGRNRNGTTSTEPTNVIRLGSPSDNNWQTVGEPMPNARRSFVIGATDGRIRLFGGESLTQSVVGPIDEFDPNSGAWTQLSSTGFTPRHGPAGATIGPSTYVVGGSLGSGSTDLTDVNERFTR